MPQPNAQLPEATQQPSALLLADALLGTQRLTDAQLLSAQLRNADVHRAETILRTTNLSSLVHAGPLELKAHGLHEDEILRLMTHLEFTIRAIAQGHNDTFTSRGDTAMANQGGQMTQKTYPHAVQIDSVVVPETYLAMALEGYATPAENTNRSKDGDTSEA